MQIDILTLFPKMFDSYFNESIIKRAINKELVKINIINLREFGKGKHKQVDDKPFGGGAGMLLMIEPIYNAINKLKTNKTKIILLSPQGKTFTQNKAKSLSKTKHIILICGRYEGFDERIRKHLIDEEISIGDYVLTGGELPAMIITDTIIRLIPNVIDPKSLEEESFASPWNEVIGSDKLEYPQYTRPEKFKKWKVPEVLLSGNHAEINKWKNN